MGPNSATEQSDAVDAWWDRYVDARPFFEPSLSGTRSDALSPGTTREVTDPWWETYAEARREDVADLRVAIERSDEQWRRSESRYDADPLSASWSNHRRAGPLRPNQEENWSQWLAHLLRTSPDLGGELFGWRFADRPESVQREVYLPDRNDPDRYADILLFYGNDGISIEVKKGDENYGKTAHTAGLIETHHDRDWNHYLLAPKSKAQTLERNLGSKFEACGPGHARISSTQSDDIFVVHWRDVSESLRAILRDSADLSSHWEASAYLFCTLIEQQILGFISRGSVTDVAQTDDVVIASRVISIAEGDAETQIEYLSDTEYIDE